MDKEGREVRRLAGKALGLGSSLGCLETTEWFLSRELTHVLSKGHPKFYEDNRTWVMLVWNTGSLGSLDLEHFLKMELLGFPDRLGMR